MPTRKEITSAIRTHIFDRFATKNGPGISDADSLTKHRIIDSLAIIILAAFLEKEFEIKFSDDDLLSDSFDTISTLSDLVQRKIKVMGRS
jgi:acyl carrier protein